MKYLVVILLACALVKAYPTVEDADYCVPDKCKLENNCRCASTINTLDKDSPQLIAITISESVVKTTVDQYIQPLFFDRKNPDGAQVGATFLVNHEYTDYELVHSLWMRGFEIGSHSITKAEQVFWRNYTKQDLIEEFSGMKDILVKFANIPKEEIIGVRTPQLQLNGDLSIEAYLEGEFQYDNSWPTTSKEHYLPYTLDYQSTEPCLSVYKCPKESHPGFWVLPITNIKGANDMECNSLATCQVEGTADEIADWLMKQVEDFRSDNRAPIVLRLDSYWFQYTDNSFEGFQKFLDNLGKLNDVFLVTLKQVYEWAKQPVPLKDFKTEVPARDTPCNAVVCNLRNNAGAERIMRSCVPCPVNYPWKGNPLGE